MMRIAVMGAKGQVATALIQAAPQLLAGAPSIEKVDILAEQLP